MAKEIKIQQEILQLINESLHSEKKMNNKKGVSLGKITKFQADIFYKRYNVDVKGYERIITADGIRHAFKHKNITAVDVTSILLIVENPDLVGLGIKENTIVYKKKFSDYLYYVECIFNGKKQLVIQTLYKRKNRLSVPKR